MEPWAGWAEVVATEVLPVAVQREAAAAAVEVLPVAVQQAAAEAVVLQVAVVPVKAPKEVEAPAANREARRSSGRTCP